MQLQHLRDPVQVGPYVRALALLDLQRGERRHRITQGGRIDLRAEAADHPVGLEPVQTCLHRSAGHAEAARGLQHPDPRLAREQDDEPAVEFVDAHVRLPVPTPALGWS
ncbi:hypothetical protein SF23_17100 [Streptomyces sp. MBRL 10]|nr:hypothetical protein SF23_17100 [Streptomyces sp. MBRL 10]